MKAIRRIFLVIVFFSFFLISCWEFLSIDQPDLADPNSTFDVPITVALTPDEGSGKGHFGIRLPIGWTVEDSISFTGVLNGIFVYSSQLSDSMELFESSPDGYHWWIGVSDSVDNLPEGNISFTPRITTDEQSGTFFIDYMISDRIEGFGDYVVHEGGYPISVGLPLSVTVTNTNNSDEGSLRQAISDVSNGGEISFDLSYPATIVLDSQLVVDHSVTITGPETGWLIISGNNQERVMSINKHLNVSINVSISNLTISGGRGGISCSNSDLNLENVKISGNNGEAGLEIYGSSPTLLNVEITGNNGQLAGGIYCGENSHINLINCTISGNKADAGIGGINLEYTSSLNIVNSIICYNQDDNIGTDFNVAEDYYIPVAVTNSLLHAISYRGNIMIYTLGDVTYDEIDPMFVDTTNGDYRLQEDSPCIDAGIQDTMIVYNDGQDTLFVPPLDYIGSAPDMGAYEFDPSTGITEKPNVPLEYSLSQNYPNPFNPLTMINYQLPKTNYVELTIYNLLGQKVATLVSGKQKAGNHQVEWDASRFASGVYYYQLMAGDYREVKKMILLR